MNKSLIIVVLFFIGNVTYASNMFIKLPTKAKNGNVVPITILANNPINPGDVLVIKGDNKVALKLSTNSNPIIKVSTRLRLKNGNVSVLIIRGDGSVDKIARSTKLNIVANSPKQNSNGSKKYKKKVKGGKIKILFSNSMALDKYIKEVNLSTNHGNVQILMTPVISKSPFLAIYGKHKFKTASINIKLNDGSKYVDTQNFIPQSNANVVKTTSGDNCSKKDVLKMVNAGYNKNEIDNICADKSYKTKPKNNNNSNKDVKAKIAKVLRESTGFTREFLNTIKMTYNNNILVFYDNCPKLMKRNDKRLSKEYAKKEKERERKKQRDKQKGVIDMSWGSFSAGLYDNPFNSSFKFKDKCYAMLNRAAKLAKTIDGVKEVEILK